MHISIWSITKSCKSCQVNKKWTLKHGHLPPKLIITIPWRALCVDLIGPYTLTGKKNTIIVDFIAPTMINPASSWFKIVELPLVLRQKTIVVKRNESSTVEEIFNKSSNCIVQLVNKTWFSRYPQWCYLINKHGSEFKQNFEYLCESWGIECKPTMVKNSQANAILQHIHQVQAQMLYTTELDMAKSVTPNDVDVFLINATWATHSTHHRVLKASLGKMW